MLEFVTMFEVL